jgi:hypothetical protein
MEWQYLTNWRGLDGLSRSLNTLGFALISWLLLGWLIYFATTPPLYPAIYPDEICNLSWARYFSGTAPHYTMTAAGACHIVYPLLLAPLYWFDLDAIQRYQGFFLLNCLFVAACFPLALRLAIRGFGVTAGQAVLIGLLVMAYPTLTLFNHHVWPESALYPLVLIAFLSYCRWVEQPDWWRFIQLGLVCLLLYLTHPKMLVFVVAWLGLIIIGLLFHRRLPVYRTRALVWLVNMCLAIFVIHMLIIQWAATLRQAGLVELLGGVIKLGHVSFSDLITKIAGQLFYAALVTGGLIWICLAVGIGSLIHAYRHGWATLSELEKKNLLIPALVLLMVVQVAVFFSSSMRFDTFFYGRHIDTLLPAALVAALALFFRHPLSVRTGVVVMLLILVCFAVFVALLPTPDWRDFSRVHVQGAAEVMQWLFGADSRQVLLGRIGLLLLGTALVIIVVSHKQWRWMGLLPLFMALSVAQVTGRPVTDEPLAQRLPPIVFETLNADHNCLITWDRSIQGRLANHQRFRLQYHFPHCEWQLVSPLSCADVEGWVITQQRTAECPAVEPVIPLPPDLLLYRPESFHR